MPHYLITMAPAPFSEVATRLLGPGIQPDGKAYVFASTERARAFAEAVNFAYEQGLRDGMRRRAAGCGPRDDRLLMVCGRTPDTLSSRRESLWERFTRRRRRLASNRF